MSAEKFKFPKINKHYLANLGNEDLFYIVGWLLVFIRPVSHGYYEYSMGLSDHMQWDLVFDDWIADFPFLFLFCISKFLLEPHYYFKQKIRSYILLSFLSAFVVMYSYSLYRASYPSVRFLHHIEKFEEQQGCVCSNPILPSEYTSPLGVLMGGQFISMFTMAVMVMGTSLCINIVFRARREKLYEKVSEAERVKTELDYLKYQINPHFFMNTLNNIHALVDIDGQLAKDAIIELSRMMRYMLYETNSSLVPMNKELEFHKHFVQLMRLRCDDSVSISYTEPSKEALFQNVMVPPLIGIVFIENAFKYGISHRHPSYINIVYEECPDYLIHFHCQNSNFSKEGIRKEGCGLGLVNVRKRLDLLYGNRYKLDIVATEKDFTVDFYCPKTIN